MDKLKMHSPDQVAGNIERLAELFPGCVTESRSENGELKRAIDFDLLRQELSDHVVEGPQERYRLDWPGKREALLAANAPIARTLRPCREESVDFDSTQNLFIEGDNLEALKLLQETYLGKVKLIYIDPPYNTGKDFIYNDDFAENATEYLQLSNQIGSEGRLVTNSDVGGRFHSSWLTMMLPRLRLARNLLQQNGVILVSINDLEVANLRHLLDEVFGSSNFVCQFIWNNEGNIDQQSKFKGVHEYIVAYARDVDGVPRPLVVDPNIEESSKLFNSQIENSITKNGPVNPASEVLLPRGFPASFENGRVEPRNDEWPHILDPIIISNSELSAPARVKSGWSSKNLLTLFINNGCEPIIDGDGKQTRFAVTNTGAIYGYKSRSESQDHVLSVLRNMGTTKKNSNMLAKWRIKFSYPKPVYLVQYLASIFCKDDSQALIVDLFAGSGTTAHAVMNLNIEDGGARRSISVQIPEPVQNGDCDAFSTVAEIAKARIRAAGNEIWGGKHESCGDTGFRVLKIDSSNMAEVYYRPDELKQDDLLGQVDNIRPGRGAEDLLFQVLLDWGVDLALPITREDIDGREVFFVDGNALAACFVADGGVDEALVKQIAQRQPIRAVFRDAGFASDNARINVEQIFKTLSPSTEVRTL